LLEHEAFSNLLLAVFHLMEELAQRHALGHLSAADQEHPPETSRGFIS
jgi:hypothetical protein